MFSANNVPVVTVNKYRLRVRHESDKSNGCSCHYIAKMISGEGRFVTADTEMIVRPGDYFYIPQGLVYRSYWRGEDAIWWDSFGFMIMPPDGEGFGMRKFVPNGEAVRLFDEIVSIGEAIAEKCSFGSANYLIRLLKKRTGKTTRELRTRDFM